MRALKSILRYNNPHLTICRYATTKKKIPDPDEDEQLPSKYLDLIHNLKD